MQHNPLLLLDNKSMAAIINQGEFKCTDLSLEEAKAIIEMYEEKDILRCFSNHEIETILSTYLGIKTLSCEHKHIYEMRVNQDAIVFKLYTTPSASQPIIRTDRGVEAKKIQNVYAYCQLLSRTK